MRSVFVILRSTFIAACSTLQQPSRTYVEALIRHELSSPKSYLSSNRQTYYVGVVSRDLSAAEISALSDTGLDFQPGSDWSLGKGMKMPIGVPVLRPDGLYDVSHSYRSEEHTSELQSLMRISYAVFCLKKKRHQP